MITVTTVAAQPGTLAIGSAIPAARVTAQRTFLGNSFGVTLGRDRSGAIYPVQTGNGGRTWRTDGPALWVPAADAPLVVTTVTATTRSLQYAFGGGGQVVDVTRTGGPTWRRALFPGTVMAVVPGTQTSSLIAYVDPESGSAIQEYMTGNGGVSWHRVAPGTAALAARFSR